MRVDDVLGMQALYLFYIMGNIEREKGMGLKFLMFYKLRTSFHQFVTDIQETSPT